MKVRLRGRRWEVDYWRRGMEVESEVRSAGELKC